MIKGKYFCPKCGYKQDFAPVKEEFDKWWPELNLQDYECPACAMGKNPQQAVVRFNKLVNDVTKNL